MVFRGGWLLLLLMLGLTGYDLGRSFLQSEEGSALGFSPLQTTQVQLVGTASHLDGIHQINDAEDLLGVIYLAKLQLSSSQRRYLLAHSKFESGESVIFQVVSNEIESIEFGWMAAALRMTLAIPLRVNRMTMTDWDDLPGVGPSLAQRIDTDRQINGEFTSLLELKRVKGVGNQRIKKWIRFFAGG